MSCYHSSFELLLLLGTWPSACYQRVDVLSQLLDIHSAFELLLGTWPCACYQRVDVLSQLFDSSFHVGFRNFNHPLRDEPGLKIKKSMIIPDHQ